MLAHPVHAVRDRGAVAHLARRARGCSPVVGGRSQGGDRRGRRAELEWVIAATQAMRRWRDDFSVAQGAVLGAWLEIAPFAGKGGAAGADGAAGAARRGVRASRLSRSPGGSVTSSRASTCGPRRAARTRARELDAEIARVRAKLANAASSRRRRRRWSTPSARSWPSSSAGGRACDARAVSVARAGAPSRPSATCSARERFGMHFGLDRMRRLMSALELPTRPLPDDPRRRHQRQVLDHADDRGAARAPGLRSGCFTSPHLFSYRERIRIGERDIAPDASPGACAGRSRAAERGRPHRRRAGRRGHPVRAADGRRALRVRARRGRRRRDGGGARRTLRRDQRDRLAGGRADRTSASSTPATSGRRFPHRRREARCRSAGGDPRRSAPGSHPDALAVAADGRAERGALVEAQPRLRLSFGPAAATSGATSRPPPRPRRRSSGDELDAARDRAAAAAVIGAGALRGPRRAGR